MEGWKWAWRSLFCQKIAGFNRGIPWPVSPFSIVLKPFNIEFHVNDLNNFQHIGCYFQNSLGSISIGRGTFIAPNVGIITANHKAESLDEHMLPHDVVIGERCWIGMNCVILPGVVLGPQTIVGAGSVVTKSFPEGRCVIAGNPAILMGFLDSEEHKK